MSMYKLVPAKYINRLNLELQRTFLVVLSLLKTHRRKAILLSMGPSTILKFITVMLPIIKLMPTLIKAVRTLSYFAKSNSNNNGNNNRNRNNALANRDANNAAAAGDGIGMSMDELNEILWTPAEDMYWERVNAMVTRFGLCKTLGITLAGVRPGRVEVVMPFRTEVSGEGGAFHASLLPTLIALTSQLTGMTLLPRYFTLKPIDFKCNILSDCDASTYLLVARGAVVVRGDHSITVKVEVLKASGSGDVSATSPSASGPSLLSWRTWVGSSAPPSPSISMAEQVLIPGTGIERSKFTICASGTQTSVVVRAGTDANDEEDKEMKRLKKEREQHLQNLKRSTSASSSSSSQILQYQQQEEFDADTEMDESTIILGDSLRVSSPTPTPPRSPSPLLTTVTKPVASSPVSSPVASTIERSSYSEVSSPSSSTVLVESSEQVANSTSSIHRILSSTSSSSKVATTTSTTSSIPVLFGSALRQDTDVSDTDHSHQHHHHHTYDATSDTEAWQGR
ncbi:hypothetical protein MVEG_12052 [Podila verticillata NRRL 6337]|uniref:Thioesterase domain-containing protein n=1 Tax=Podila verticillata NRRL 6337 TaxID=1069443 RepID=A0A086TL33_9FUNG|nr:hypothetical protein MVEG_12052 [Podila verticillata NRRL 6337]